MPGLPARHAAEDSDYSPQGSVFDTFRLEREAAVATRECTAGKGARTGAATRVLLVERNKADDPMCGAGATLCVALYLAQRRSKEDLLEDLGLFVDLGNP